MFVRQRQGREKVKGKATTNDWEREKGHDTSSTNVAIGA